MTDYTPTTEEVRHGWKWRDDEEFAQWFAEVKAQACSHTFAQQLEEHSLAELIRMAKADAWDRGYEAGLTDFASSMTTNPYRQGENSE